MKNKLIFKIIAFFIAFSPALTFAQAVVSDTVYTEQKSNGLFYKTTVYYYDDARLDFIMQSRLIGDSTALYETNKTAFEQRGSDMSVEVRSTATFSREITAIVRENNKVKASTGKSPLDSLQKENIEYFTSGTWTVRGDTSQNIAFTVTAAGQLRYRINNGTARNATVIGKHIVRLINYDGTNKDRDFFFNGKTWFITQDNKRRLQRRAAAAK